MTNRETIKKILKTSIISVAILIVLGYAIFASHNFILGPKIVLYEPVNGSSVSTSTIVVRGLVMRIKDLTLNGKPIIIDNEGNFKESLLLSPGYNVSLLSAQDRFKRTIEYKLELVYLK